MMLVVFSLILIVYLVGGGMIVHRLNEERKENQALERRMEEITREYNLRQ